MLEKKLESLTKSLKLAKELNKLTASNIFTLVSKTSIQIVKKSRFDRCMTKFVLKGVLDTALGTLDDLGDLTIDNIIASNEGVMDALKKV